MKQSNQLIKYYDIQCEQMRQLIIEKCKTVNQRTAICTMTLERCNMQFSFLESTLPILKELSMYRKILDDMERFACDDKATTAEMAQGYEDWCLQITELLEHGAISNQNYLSHWQLQLLPGLIEKLGVFFTSGTPPYWDDIEVSLIGVWLLFMYETVHKYPNPKNFNYYVFIRSRHPDIEAIGKERDELRTKLSQSVIYRDAYDIISATYRNECEKYMGEAAAEHKRLKAEYRPLAREDLVLTMRELERIRADVQFITTENPTKEDIRQRLQYYRTLDIASEETDTSTAANANDI